MYIDNAYKFVRWQFNNFCTFQCTRTSSKSHWELARYC